MKKLRWARPKKVAHNENAVVYCGPKRSDESNPDKGDFAFPCETLSINKAMRWNWLHTEDCDKAVITR